jgi:hypothetical protein
MIDYSFVYGLSEIIRNIYFDTRSSLGFHARRFPWSLASLTVMGSSPHTPMNSLQKYSLVLAAGMFLPVFALAQVVSYSAVNSTYSQNFDGLGISGSVITTSTSPIAIQGKLGSTGMDGWYMLNDRGSSSVTEFRAQNGSLGSSAGRGVISFGTTGSTERALGFLATSNQVSTFGVFLRNDTASTLNQFSLSYIGEQWRAGGTGLDNDLTFRFKVVSSLSSTDMDGDNVSFTTVSALSFHSPYMPGSSPTEVALNGNNSLYQQSLSAVQTLTWAPGQYLVLQWVGEDLSGQDNGLAIDNLSFSAIPEPSTYAAILGAASLAVALWRRRGFKALSENVA